MTDDRHKLDDSNSNENREDAGYRPPPPPPAEEGEYKGYRVPPPIEKGDVERPIESDNSE